MASRDTECAQYPDGFNQPSSTISCSALRDERSSEDAGQQGGQADWGLGCIEFVSSLLSRCMFAARLLRPVFPLLITILEAAQAPASKGGRSVIDIRLKMPQPNM
ncbi:hypothetical protein OE88DRAFT_872380 [Heliocybe sulcata]|uniref:Uncharacterized protein n=1 Tax=Heliocybe sulcata TaxID=5364 RepID=A0A5C3MZE8_9AGAM|nr:hypothetical protein OE88DRAFT_872380 [Heliocybe sulcata]